MVRKFGRPLLLAFSFASCLSAQVSVQRVGVSEGVMQAMLIHKVDPKYPADATVRGSVVLQAVIGKAGNVDSLQTISGDPMLIPAAMEAVKQWSYQPYLLNGIPVEVETTIHLDFAPPEQSPTEQSAPERNDPGTTTEMIEVPYEAIQGFIVRKVAPLYPPLARQARIQGPVVLSVIINKAGEVREANLVSGHPMLAPAAVQAVKQWRYRPYLSGDQPADVRTTVRVNFKLANSPAQSGTTPPVSEPDSAATSPPHRVRVSSGVAEGLVLNKVSPEYPDEARQKRIQGTVNLAVNIDKEGNVTRVELAAGDPLLAPAAMDAVLQWKYRPFLLSGEPVAMETTVRVNFTLQQ